MTFLCHHIPVDDAEVATDPLLLRLAVALLLGGDSRLSLSEISVVTPPLFACSSNLVDFALQTWWILLKIRGYPVSFAPLTASHSRNPSLSVTIWNRLR